MTPCLSCACRPTRCQRPDAPDDIAPWAPWPIPPRRAAHLGSVRPAVCRTRPQYVLRSYRDSGRALWPGSEADIVFFFLVGLESSGEMRVRRCRRVAGKGQEEVSGAPIREWRLSKGWPSCFPSSWCRLGEARALATATGHGGEGDFIEATQNDSELGARSHTAGRASPMPLLPRPTGAGRRCGCCCGCLCGCAMCTRQASCRGKAATASSPPTMDGQTSKEPSFHPAASKQQTELRRKTVASSTTKPPNHSYQLCKHIASTRIAPPPWPNPVPRSDCCV